MSWDALVVRNGHAILHTQLHGCLELVFEVREAPSKMVYESRNSLVSLSKYESTSDCKV